MSGRASLMYELVTGCDDLSRCIRPPSRHHFLSSVTLDRRRASLSRPRIAAALLHLACEPVVVDVSLQTDFSSSAPATFPLS